MTDDEADMYYDRWLALKNRVKMLESGPGGIMEMKQTIADKEAELRKATEYAFNKAAARIEKLEKTLNDVIETLDSEKIPYMVRNRHAWFTAKEALGNKNDTH